MGNTYRWWQTSGFRGSFLGAAGLAFLVAACWASLSAFQARSQKESARCHHSDPSPRPLLTGSDGSETGIADFVGNFTSITTPSQSYFLMVRQPDCSLTLYTGQSSASEPDVTGTIPHYERTLHQLASLKTTADVFANGCAEPSTGISARPVLSLGRLSSGVGLFAAARGMGTGTVAANFSSLTYTAHPPLPTPARSPLGT